MFKLGLYVGFEGLYATFRRNVLLPSLWSKSKPSKELGTGLHDVTSRRRYYSPRTLRQSHFLFFKVNVSLNATIVTGCNAEVSRVPFLVGARDFSLVQCPNRH